MLLQELLRRYQLDMELDMEKLLDSRIQLDMVQIDCLLDRRQGE